MARPFKELRNRRSPEARERIDQRVRETLLEMTLQELHQRVAGVTQTELAEADEGDAGSDLSAREAAGRPALSKLADCIHALGGDLELVARFPDAEVRITQFDTEKKADDGLARVAQ